MKKIQEWIEKYLVPVINKVTSNYWFSLVADAILYIVPFSMVSACLLYTSDAADE